MIHVETTAGEPISVDEREIVPIARSVRVQMPLLRGGLIWNRPVAVVVRAANGQEYELPVRDVTRRAQLFVVAVGILSSFLMWLVLRRR
jgi:hypothetical protein